MPSRASPEGHEEGPRFSLVPQRDRSLGPLQLTDGQAPAHPPWICDAPGGPIRPVSVRSSAGIAVRMRQCLGTAHENINKKVSIHQRILCQRMTVGTLRIRVEKPHSPSGANLACEAGSTTSSHSHYSARRSTVRSCMRLSVEKKKKLVQVGAYSAVIKGFSIGVLGSLSGPPLHYIPDTSLLSSRPRYPHGKDLAHPYQVSSR